MTLTELVIVLFTVCNTLRVFAYMPQLIRVGRDRQGASAVSLTTWGLFAISNFTTMAYAIVVLDDWRMAVIFGANTLCCVAIVGVTLLKRSSQRTPAAISRLR